MASVKILDGGLGTSLQDKYGVEFNSTSTPLWSSHMLVSDPATLLACQRDFTAAGVDMLLTATYQASIEGFRRTKTADFPNGIPRSAIGSFLETAVRVAEQARGSHERVKIALSLGPYGACMIPGQEYSGKYDETHNDEDALFHWHLDRLHLFMEADGDLLSRVEYVAFETLPRLDEIRAVRRAMHTAGLTVPFWIACVFPGTEPEFMHTLPDGSSIEEIVSAALAPMDDGVAPWGVGINCTKTHKVPYLVERFGDCVSKLLAGDKIQTLPSLVLYPDGTNGEVYNTTTQKWEKPDMDIQDRLPWETQLADVVHNAQQKGPFQSFLIGGCCKTTHDDIRRLRQRI
ncbi:homocysteine S-methyltransferase [Talaromyces pinophilus]|uniref:Homocysteine S-methyltransferase n=1 Tax=Talaromyces pinophilus TaxID=128442 RepID=A0A0B8MYT4_TALPI|nr:homocysteine S-methyltransferase [Talaromyces pinophilus]